MGQRFVSAREPVTASELIRPLAAHGDTYVGVVLRDRAQGGRNAVSKSHLLWVEVDADDAYKRLLALDPKNRDVFHKLKTLLVGKEHEEQYQTVLLEVDNADPSAIRAACAKCGKVSRFIGTAQQETEGL